MVPLKLITFGLKTTILPYWTFKAMTNYAVITLNINPTLAFIVSAGAACGTLVVSLKIPI